MPAKAFNIKLSAEHRAKLEVIRASLGLRSEADAIRRLIADWRSKSAPMTADEIRSDSEPFSGSADIRAVARLGGDLSRFDLHPIDRWRIEDLAEAARAGYDEAAMTEEDRLAERNRARPFKGVTATGEPLPERKPYQKKPRK